MELLSGVKLRFGPDGKPEDCLFGAYLNEDALSIFENLEPSSKESSFERMVSADIYGPLVVRKVHYRSQLSLFTKKSRQSVTSVYGN